ncbi:MAG: hypothetical protein L3J51_01495 [Cocleimonas sp.]|nr:hypothetical protein [Cocleimonas sp.]
MTKQRDKRLEEMGKKIPLGYPQRKGYVFKYSNDFETSSFPQTFIKRFLDDGYGGFGFFPGSCENLTRYSLYRAIYAAEILDDKALAVEELSRAGYYGYMGVHVSAIGCGFNIEYMPFIEMNLATELFFAPVLMNDWSKADKVAVDLIDSLNAKACIITRGQPDLEAHPLWFILKMYSQLINKPIDARKPFHPKDFEAYDNVIEKWDTDDLVEVEKMSYLLMDMHYEIYRSDKGSRTFLATFPYEVIVWLKLRERKGLANPSSLSHPFMKQKIMQLILTSKERFPPPATLPFASRLFKGLKKEYSTIDIPGDLDLFCDN